MLHISIRAPARGATTFPATEWNGYLFQFAPPRGGRQPAAGLRGHLRISIRAPARGATTVARYVSYSVVFQFAPPRGGRHGIRRNPHRRSISIRAPARGATQPVPESKKPDKFQFAPPRGGRPFRAFVEYARSISIRAPARGATLFVDREYKEDEISIRAPARGATTDQEAAPAWHLFQFAPPRGGRPNMLMCMAMCIYFNSRPREGGDQSAIESGEYMKISIRAPARGATPPLWKTLLTVLFQFAPPRGGRPAGRQCPERMIPFQFAPPRGGRPTVA